VDRRLPSGDMGGVGGVPEDGIRLYRPFWGSQWLLPLAGDEKDNLRELYFCFKNESVNVFKRNENV